MYGVSQGIAGAPSNVAQQDYINTGAAQNISNQAASQTLMQALYYELGGLLSMARANLDAVMSQRGRLIGDLPPTADAPRDLDGPGRPDGASVSFNEIAVSIEKLKGTLLTANEHLMAMRKIG